MKFKQALRWAGFALLLLLALCGIGIPPNPHRPKDFENEVKIELVERKRDEDISDIKTQKEVNQ